MLNLHSVLAISMNNPYSAVLRNKVANYFDSDQSAVYVGLASAGVPAVYHHRTWEKYFGEFGRNGLYLRTFRELKPSPAHLASHSPKARQYYHFPFFAVLELVKLKSE
jgi:hypothetical protein